MIFGLFFLLDIGWQGGYKSINLWNVPSRD